MRGKRWAVVVAAGIITVTGCGSESAGYRLGHAAAVAFVSESPDLQGQQSTEYGELSNLTLRGSLAAIGYAYSNDDAAYGPIELPASPYDAAQLICSDAEADSGNVSTDGNYNLDWVSGCEAGLQGK